MVVPSSEYPLHRVMDYGPETGSTSLYHLLRAGAFSHLDQLLLIGCLYRKRRVETIVHQAKQKMSHRRKRSNQREPSKIFWYLSNPMRYLTRLTTTTQRIFSYADKYDWCLNAVALLGSIGAGAGLPLMTLIFGQLVAKFNAFQSGQSDPDTFRDDISHFVSVTQLLIVYTMC